jgi:hypothetical protein
MRITRCLVMVPAVAAAMISMSRDANACPYYCTGTSLTPFIGYTNNVNVSDGIVDATFESAAGHGVWAKTDVDGYAGIHGQGMVAGSIGVWGGANGIGVYGTTSSSSADAIYGYCNNGWSAVAGQNEGSGPGIWGSSVSGYAGQFEGSIYVSSTVNYGSLHQNSDIRLKKNVQPLDVSIDDILKLHGATWEWKDPVNRGDGTQTGFIAQDFEKVFPQWVTTNKDGFKTINTGGIDALLIEALRSLKERADKAEARAEKAEAHSKTQDERLDALEANRRPLISTAMADRALFGLGLVALGGVFVFTRRRRSEE